MAISVSTVTEEIDRENDIVPIVQKMDMCLLHSHYIVRCNCQNSMNILKLVEYNIWANRLIMDQVEKLPQELFEKQVGGSFGSLKATIIHLLESDWIWLNRFKGIPLTSIPDWQNANAFFIHEEWKAVQEETRKIAVEIGDQNKNIEFLTKKGVRFVLPFEEIATHISHHGSYHRGQLTNMIRALEQKPVSTDYFIFCTQ
jgi:uncharacterized damage-inducible protein DinB